MPLDRLIAYLRPLEGGVLVACSGGLDSAVVAGACVRAGLQTLAVTGVSPTTPPWDVADARLVAGHLGLEHRLAETAEMSDPRFTANPPDRCYYCKDTLFTALKAIATAEGYAHVADGSNADDRADHRPGLRAAAAHGVISPLMEAGLTKADARAAARALGLPVADKPASPCLSSRFPYGVPITPEGLSRTARAEAFLRSLGVTDVRVRDHHGVARIEAPVALMDALYARRAEVVSHLLSLGYEAVCLDMEGLLSGKLNRSLGLFPLEDNSGD
jgi:uncharacterized protein